MEIKNSSGENILVGIIGLGVGEAHLLSYQSIKNVEVRAICDLNQSHLERIAKKYDIAKKYTDYRKIVEDPDIDVVSICSYDNYHAQQIISALQNGKHVMVEKPAVLHPHEAEAVLRELEGAKRFITSNLILRQSPRFREVRKRVINGDLGEVFHIEADYLHQILWKITTGWRGKMDFYCTVYGGGIHMIDLMRWIMRKEITSVCAMGTSKAVKGSNYQWPDTITALLEWDDGATGKCTTSLAVKRTKFHSLNVYGTKKTFVNDQPAATLFSGDDPKKDLRAITTPYPGMEKGDLLPEFIDCIRNGVKPAVNEVDIFRVMSVCFAIWESVSARKTVPVNQLI